MSPLAFVEPLIALHRCRRLEFWNFSKSTIRLFGRLHWQGWRRFAVFSIVHRVPWRRGPLFLNLEPWQWSAVPRRLRPSTGFGSFQTSDFFVNGRWRLVVWCLWPYSSRLGSVIGRVLSFELHVHKTSEMSTLLSTFVLIVPITIIIIDFWLNWIRHKQSDCIEMENKSIWPFKFWFHRIRSSRAFQNKSIRQLKLWNWILVSSKGMIIWLHHNVWWLHAIHKNIVLWGHCSALWRPFFFSIRVRF